MERVQHWIDGKLTAGSSSETSPVHNPATGEQTAELTLATSADVDAAVASARAAADSWSHTSLATRTKVLFAFRELLAAHTDELAALVTSEHGKVLSDAAGEVARGLENVEYACGVANLMKGEFSEQASTGVDVYSIRQPVGVIAGITPFNFPLMVPLWMCANAIACGNAFILKPSEKDPSVSLLLADLWRQAGLPDGVFTVLQGDKVAVDGLLQHPQVDAISFVGSTPIAQYIYETGTKAAKRVQALGGAKNHMMVLPDADLEVAADAAVSAAYGAAGERCMAISVIVAVGSVADPLIDAIKERLPSLRIGPGDQDGSEMGPLITAEHREKVIDYIDRGEQQGAKVVVDGRTGRSENGFFLGCTLLDDVSPENVAYTDEIFGPVLAIVRVDNFDKGLDLINSHQFANGTAIFTRDGGAVRRFQRDVQVGMIGVNVPIPVPVGYYSFGGWKASLFGDTHMYGPEGINFCTRRKVVTSRWPDPGSSKIDLGFPTNADH
ncbi:CoA-acylating methylmalonate-semialdehyde dehydrogenase [Flexivirga sp.]|uniref:CoA-acylating methylmalonate-semialdehyde dehydrogenase n=1 Tax=Flexivirga sp. TaxID=1962927 RepID=UPI003F7D13D1